ncbi:hypothetical protein UY3_01184 [Chelonia mydas]|uniref:Uncharacterized protein n=1 Tax=Chelonia mydas TaxID=8469 RepID=M7BUM8_CHEMY|nr:hypothetical protein UY3_01184 [Chelonia mydas]
MRNFSYVNSVAEVDVLRSTYRGVFTVVSRQLMLSRQLCLHSLLWWSTRVDGRALNRPPLDRSLPADPEGSVDKPTVATLTMQGGKKADYKSATLPRSAIEMQCVVHTL